MTRVLFNQNVYLKIGQTLVTAHFSEHAGLTETTSSIKEDVESWVGGVASCWLTSPCVHCLSKEQEWFKGSAQEVDTAGTGRNDIKHFKINLNYELSGSRPSFYIPLAQTEPQNLNSSLSNFSF